MNEEKVSSDKKSCPRPEVFKPEAREKIVEDKEVAEEVVEEGRAEMMIEDILPVIGMVIGFGILSLIGVGLFRYMKSRIKRK